MTIKTKQFTGGTLLALRGSGEVSADELQRCSGLAAIAKILAVVLLLFQSVSAQPADEPSFDLSSTTNCRPPGRGQPVPVAKRNPVQIDPELKDFLDTCVIPLLIRAALAKSDFQEPKKAIVFESASVADYERKNVEASR